MRFDQRPRVSRIENKLPEPFVYPVGLRLSISDREPKESFQADGAGTRYVYQVAGRVGRAYRAPVEQSDEISVEKVLVFPSAG